MLWWYQVLESLHGLSQYQMHFHGIDGSLDVVFICRSDIGSSGSGRFSTSWKWCTYMSACYLSVAYTFPCIWLTQMSLDLVRTIHFTPSSSLLCFTDHILHKVYFVFSCALFHYIIVSVSAFLACFWSLADLVLSNFSFRCSISSMCQMLTIPYNVLSSFAVGDLAVVSFHLPICLQEPWSGFSTPGWVDSSLQGSSFANV